MADTDLAAPAIEIDIARINSQLEALAPQEILRWASELFHPDAILTCSFQHDGVMLSHMLQAIAPWMPVVFIDTGFHFDETLSYMEEIRRRFGINLRVIRPSMPRKVFADKHGLDLNKRDPDLCCSINKVEPLAKALEGVNCWINGRRRQQATTRKSLTIVERFQGGIYKVNPLTNWTAQDTLSYMKTHSIPEHPLFEKGYASIGCAPCTRPIMAGEDDRAGRWTGTGKTECGIHTFLKPES